MTKTMLELLIDTLKSLEAHEAIVRRKASEELSAIAKAKQDLQEMLIEFNPSQERHSEVAHVRSSAREEDGDGKKMTIKQAVSVVLHERVEGLTALEILPLVNELLGTQYPRTSLSPQLSRMQQEGTLERHGNVWRLVPSVDR